jgi:hypothetical protein
VSTIDIRVHWLSGVVAILSWCLLGKLGEEVPPRLGEGR